MIGPLSCNFKTARGAGLRKGLGFRKGVRVLWEGISISYSFIVTDLGLKKFFIDVWKLESDS